MPSGVIARAHVATAEDIDTDQADSAGHAVTVLIEKGKGRITGNGEVHLDAVEDFLERRWCDEIGADDLGEFPSERRDRLVKISAADFLAPLAKLAAFFLDGQFGRVRHVVNDTAKRVKNGHGTLLRLGQRREREREVRFARLGDGFASRQGCQGVGWRSHSGVHEARALRNSTAISLLPSVGRWLRVS
jgi:hypothetical protein